jgi:protein TonB
MDVLFSLVAIALAISLYDYYTVKNWQQSTSDTRNDIVFEKRNKAYGAYVIRRDYNREMTLILLGIVFTISATYGSYLFFKSDPVAIDMKRWIPDDELRTFDPPTIKIAIPVIDDTQLKQTKVDMVKATDYVVTDNPTKGKKVDLLDLDIIQGPSDIKGTGSTGFTHPVGGGSDVGTRTGGQTELQVPTRDPDISAEYPGGREKMVKYLTSNLNYPEIARLYGIQGKCHLQFIINKQGDISDIKIVRAVPDCVECDQEAIRVIKKMPKWKPAIKDGQKVDSYFVMPINFSLR